MGIQKRTNNEGVVFLKKKPPGSRNLPRSYSSYQVLEKCASEWSALKPCALESTQKLFLQNVHDLENIFKHKKSETIGNTENYLCYDNFVTVFVMKTKLTPEETCRESWSGNIVLVCKVSRGSRKKKELCSDCQ